MIKRSTHSVVIAQLVACLCAASVDAADDDISGVWINTDADTRGIVKLAIVEKDSKPTIRVWGACTPEYCDWGTTKLHRLGDSVESKILPFGLATWDFNFATTHLTLQLTHEKVVVTSFTVFKDSSDRANYRAQYTFRRAEAEEADRPQDKSQIDDRDLIELTPEVDKQEASLRSVHSNNPTYLRFKNISSTMINIYWLDFQGNRKKYGSLQPGELMHMNTFLTHPWVITDSADDLIGIYMPISENAIVAIRED